MVRQDAEMCPGIFKQKFVLKEKTMTNISGNTHEKTYFQNMNDNTLYQQHRDWLSQLDFYQDEIKIFQHELTQVVEKHPDYLSIIEHVDEYQRIFEKKLEKIDHLKHQIALHLKQEGATALEEHEQLQARMGDLVKNFEALKKNFRRFASRND